MTHHHPPIPSVVTAEWLKDNLQEVKVLDTSWYLPPMGRDAQAEFGAERIAGAAFWDIDGVADPGTDLPHMLPSEGAFAAAADALGIANGDALVVYDGLGMFAAPRAWWTWRVFGHDRVAVLEGGLPAWKAAGGPTDTSPATPEQLVLSRTASRAAAGSSSSSGYKAVLKNDKVRSLAEMLQLVGPAAAAAAAQQPLPALQQQVVDARPAGRFAGVDPEPRPGLRKGHMPGAANVPFVQVYEGGQLAGARLKPVDELQAAFEAAGVDVQAPLVCSCGSGLTACVLALALHQITGQLVPVYDGSWSEWGDPALDTPIVTGAAAGEQQ